MQRATTTMTTTRPAARSDLTIAAVLDLLTETWPACFSIYERRRKPLKIGIHRDILAVLDGAVTPAELSRALRCYVANKVYRERLIAGAVRVGLDGKPAGEVTAEQVPSPTSRQAASAPTLSPPPSPSPLRITLRDLREAAQQRRNEDSAK